jgi:hypothetical protein
MPVLLADHVTEPRDLLLGGSMCGAKEDRRQPATSRLRGVRIAQRAGSDAMVRGIGGMIAHQRQDTSKFLYRRNPSPPRSKAQWPHVGLVVTDSESKPRASGRAWAEKP